MSPPINRRRALEVQFAAVDPADPNAVEDVGTRLAELLAREGSTADALGVLEEVGELLRAAERNPRSVYERMVALDPVNALFRLRLAESLVVEGKIDRAVDAFLAGATELARLRRYESVVKVVLRVLHFRPEPAYVERCGALLAAEPEVLSLVKACIEATPEKRALYEALLRAVGGVAN